MLNVQWTTEEEKNQKYSDRPDEGIQHFIVEWTDADSKHFQICNSFDEAFSLYEGLSEVSGEPGCPISDVSCKEVYLY
jgi:hypothetical protein